MQVGAMATASAAGSGLTKVATNVAEDKNAFEGVGTAVISGGVASAAGAGCGKMFEFAGKAS